MYHTHCFLYYFYYYVYRSSKIFLWDTFHITTDWLWYCQWKREHCNSVILIFSIPLAWNPHCYHMVTVLWRIFIHGRNSTTTTTTALFENWKLGDSHCHWYGLKMEITSIQIDEITIAEWLWEFLLTLIRSRRLFVSLECIVMEFHFIAIHFHLINFEWSSKISN